MLQAGTGHKRRFLSHKSGMPEETCPKGKLHIFHQKTKLELGKIYIRWIIGEDFNDEAAVVSLEVAPEMTVDEVQTDRLAVDLEFAGNRTTGGKGAVGVGDEPVS